MCRGRQFLWEAGFDDLNRTAGAPLGLPNSGCGSGDGPLVTGSASVVLIPTRRVNATFVVEPRLIGILSPRMCGAQATQCFCPYTLPGSFQVIWICLRGIVWCNPMESIGLCMTGIGENYRRVWRRADVVAIQSRLWLSSAVRSDVAIPDSVCRCHGQVFQTLKVPLNLALLGIPGRPGCPLIRRSAVGCSSAPAGTLRGVSSCSLP
jgi:hypothetical protein